MAGLDRRYVLFGKAGCGDGLESCEGSQQSKGGCAAVMGAALLGGVDVEGGFGGEPIRIDEG